MLTTNQALAQFGISPADFFDLMGLAIWPVRDEFKDEPCAGCTHFVQCDPEQAQFWGLYGVTPNGDHVHLYDYQTERDAFRAAGEVLTLNMGLFRRGISLNY
jgi:hypothetical protein